MENQAKSLPAGFRFYAEGSIARTPEVERRFISRFNEAWANLPAEAHLTIGRAAEANPIAIQFRDRHHSLTRGPSGAATAQMICVLDTFEIIYSSFYASRFSDAVCRYWIAHELGHVYLRATDPSHGSDYDAAEREVGRLLVDRWGYRENDESDLEVERHLIDKDVPVR